VRVWQFTQQIGIFSQFTGLTYSSQDRVAAASDSLLTKRKGHIIMEVLEVNISRQTYIKHKLSFQNGSRIKEKLSMR
jgi:hypothetical protein